MHSTRNTHLHARRYATVHPYMSTDTYASDLNSGWFPRYFRLKYYSSSYVGLCYLSSSTSPSAARTPSPTRRRRRRRQDETLPLRPRNAFILFRSHYYRTVAQSNARSVSPSASDDLYVSIRQNDLSSEAAAAWKAMTDLEKAPFRDEAEKLKEEYHIALAEVRNLQKKRYLAKAPQPSSTPSTSVSPAPVFSLPIENFGSVPRPQCTEDNSSTPFNPVWQFSGTSYPSQYTFGLAQDQMLYPNMSQVSDEQVYTELCTAYLQSYPSSPSADASSPNFDITLATIPNTDYQVPPLSSHEAAVLGVAPSYIACEDVQVGFGFGMVSPSLFPTFDFMTPAPIFGWENLVGGDVESGCYNTVATF